MASPFEKVPKSVLQQWAAMTDQPIQIRDWHMVPLCGFFGVLSIAVITSRFWYRARIIRKLDLSDYFSLVALLFTLASLAVTMLCVKRGQLGRHTYDLKYGQLELLLKYLFASIFFTNLSEGSARLAVLLFYRLLLRDVPNKYYSAALWGAFVLVIVTWISFTISVMRLCTPLNAFWLQFSPEFLETSTYTCYDHSLFLMITSGINAFLDILIALMPIPLLWSLKLSLRNKIEVFLLLGSFGIGASFAACRRIYWIYVAFYKSYDFTWDLYGALFWTGLECTFALIGCSLPALKGLYTHTNKKWRQRRSNIPAGIKKRVFQAAGVLAPNMRHKATLHDATSEKPGDDDKSEDGRPFWNLVTRRTKDVEDKGVILVTKDIEVSMCTQVETLEDDYCNCPDDQRRASLYPAYRNE